MTAPAASPTPPAAGAEPAPIYFGIAGWSYPDWDGYVYGPRTRDKLRFIAAYVDAIEINSTFYRPPDARTTASWQARTADLPAFFFTAKLHQDITHGGRIEEPTARAFHEGLRPLIEAQRLKHLLAQFRYDFADTPAARDRLSRIRERFGELANLTLELRHRSWQAPAALEFLQSLRVSVAHLDYPAAANSFTLRLCPVGEHAYFRLHGRNAQAWFRKDAGRDEAYNWLYSAAEIDEIARRAADIARQSRSLTLIANNHYQGKEAVNILQLKARLTGRKVPVPPQLAEKYPELRPLCAALPPASAPAPPASP